MAGRQIVVEIVGDSTKFGNAAQGAVTKAEGLTGKLQGIGKGMVIGAGIGAFGLLTTGVGLAISKLDEAHQAFLDDQVSSERLANSLKNNIPNWDGNRQGAEDFATAQAKLGFADDDVRSSLGQLVGVTHDLNEAQQLSSLAMDLSRAKGIDLATATDIVTKAHEGNGRALKGLGIDIQGAKTGADFLAAAQKNVQGAAESWAATNEGKLAVSNVKVGEAMEKVGGIVDKVSQVVIPIFADALTGVVDILSQVATAVGPVVSQIATNLAPVLQKAGVIAGQVFGFISSVVVALAPVFRTIFGVIGQVIGAAVGVWRQNFGIVQAALGVLAGVFRTIFGVIGAVVGALAPVVRTVFGVVGAVIGAAVGVVKGYFAILGAAIGVLESGFRVLGSFVGAIAGGIGRVFRGAINAVIGAVNGIISGINSIQLHIHINPPIGPSIGFDWNGMNLGRIGYLHSGGIVPGAAGSDVLAVLQAGEVVTPASGAGGAGGNVFDFRGSTILGGPAGLDELADLIAGRLRMRGTTIR